MPPHGYKHSEYTKRKISLSLVGHKLSNATKKRIADAHLGKKRPPFSDEHKKRIGESHIGIKPSKETRLKIGIGGLGRIPWNKDKKWPEEIKKKMCKPHINARGKNASNWRGGITPINNKIRGSIEYKLWQDSVFARDGYTCQKCHEIMKPYLLVGHHILNFSSHIELRMAIDNGCTLCKKHHKEFHKKYGKRNNTREQLEEFLNYGRL